MEDTGKGCSLLLGTALQCSTMPGHRTAVAGSPQQGHSTCTCTDPTVIISQPFQQHQRAGINAVHVQRKHPPWPASHSKGAGSRMGFHSSSIPNPNCIRHHGTSLCGGTEFTVHKDGKKPGQGNNHRKEGEEEGEREGGMEK